MLSSVRTSLRDFYRFGPAILSRHLARLRSNPEFTLDVRGYGRIHLRTKGLDLDLARIVLVEGAYDFPCPEPAADRLERRSRAILESGRTPVILNAGAHIGLSALWFARKWPKAQVVSVEPDPGNLDLLRRNLADRSRHTVIEAAIGSTRGKAVLSDTAEGCAVQTERSDRGVQIVTVEDALARVPSGAPFICNIDIEGFEADLFGANTDWIDRFALVIIEPHDWRQPGAMISRNFQREMATRPFEIYPHRDTLYYLQA